MRRQLPTALITGVAGQDGAYLSALLRGKGYHVVGMVAPGREVRPDLIPYLEAIELVRGTMQDTASLRSVIKQCNPDEVYNLAGVSSVARSWVEPELTADVNGTGVLRLVRALLDHGEDVGRVPRLLQASSSEMFGTPSSSTQDETTPLAPRSPYALAKAFAHESVAMFRESHGLFASCAILFNHESPLRPPTFVTRKISSAVAAISQGRADQLVLGDLAIRRDWGSARDYVEAMWLALQVDDARDYIVATGRTRSIRDWVEAAFSVVDIKDWEPLVTSDPALVRPTEPGALVGDVSRSRELLGWEASTGFHDLVAEMVHHDLDLLSRASAS
jgi:GDPmannose 4,6-dehydratase